MLEAIRRFVSERLIGAANPEATAAAATSPSRVQLAACALLLELAHADGEFSTEEQRHI